MFQYCNQAETQSKQEPGETQSEPGVSLVPLTLFLKEAEEELGETQLLREAGETREAGKTREAMKTRETMKTREAMNSKALEVAKTAEQTLEK